MSAGLPGLGLGGLFFIASALLAPFLEIGRITLGRRREVDWPQVWRQFALALTMIFAVDLTLRAVYAFAQIAGIGNTPRIDVITVIPLIPVGITACLLAAVLLSAKAVDLATPVLRELPPITSALPSRSRALAVTGVVGAIWFGLLFTGASDLTRLPGRDGGAEDDLSGQPLADADVEAAEAGAGSPSEQQIAGVEASGAGPVAESQPPATPVTAESQGRDSADGVGAGAAAPTDPGTGPGPTASPGPTDTVDSPIPPPTSSAPEGAGPPTDAPAPDTTDPPVQPGPPEDAGPPEDHGPPPEAGPPEHSNAPPHAGPG
jgi:hypothetical protein